MSDRGGGGLVWLGESDEGMVRAFGTVRALAEDCGRWVRDEGDVRWVNALGHERKRMLEYWDAPEPPGCDWEALGGILERRWFSKLWVVQEVAVAQRAYCICGTYHVDWDVFARAVRWVELREWTMASDTFRSTERFVLVSQMLNCRDNLGTEDNDLYTLLSLNFQFETSNPWDTVYALLGIVHEHHVGHVPDYRWPLKELFAWLALATIESFHRVWIPLTLSMCSTLLCHETPDNWPTWVSMLQHMCGHMRVLGLLEEVRDKSSLPDARAQLVLEVLTPPSRLVDRDVLHVQGISTARIAAVLDPMDLFQEATQGG